MVSYGRDLFDSDIRILPKDGRRAQFQEILRTANVIPGTCHDTESGGALNFAGYVGVASSLPGIAPSRRQVPTSPRGVQGKGKLTQVLARRRRSNRQKSTKHYGVKPAANISLRDCHHLSRHRRPSRASTNKRAARRQRKEQKSEGKEVMNER